MKYILKRGLLSIEHDLAKLAEVCNFGFLNHQHQPRPLNGFLHTCCIVFVDQTVNVDAQRADFDPFVDNVRPISEHVRPNRIDVVGQSDKLVGQPADVDARRADFIPFSADVAPNLSNEDARSSNRLS